MPLNYLDSVYNHKYEFFNYFNFLAQKEKKLFVQGDLEEFYKEHLAGTKEENLHRLITPIQEALCLGYTMYIDIREKIGEGNFYIIKLEETLIEKISAIEYLKAKEAFVNPGSSNDLLNINFMPFYDKSPFVKDIKSIGTGVEYLNRYLSSQMFNNSEKWKELLFDFIRLHKYNSHQLILNERIKNPDHLNENIDKAIEKLSEYSYEKPNEEIIQILQELGFEKGLGKTPGDIIESLKLLDNLLNSPDHLSLKNFISRIPMIFNIVIVSPHGYFGQEGVLGLPDTGGQVVYILDQVKALEKALGESLKNSGLDILPKILILTRLIPNAGNTKCNKRLEKVDSTKNSWILRVPFRTHNPQITDNWISRFEIWPYLEDFSEDASVEILAELGRRPDLVIGNYSDGNLVAYRLSKKFNVTQCGIAHALEKSKYLFSALYWKDMEQQYNFSLQFTADLISINSANFLITSSFQEIAGTDSSIGQYESYKHFTMPGLYRVENGVDLYHTKFNIVSPGVNTKIFFPYTNKSKRISSIGHTLNELLFENKEDEDVVGILEDTELTPIFSMARLDKIKNLTSLVEWFGENSELQKLGNLIIVSGKVDVNKSSDWEEKEQINLMHELINRYSLHKKIRWIGKLFNKNETGETYRLIADRKGIFVQPALFEGFGLTILEAMISGLPVFATKYGGPLEIIQNKKCGFHIDPVNGKESVEEILQFIKRIKNHPDYWERISQNAVARVNESYNWKLYTKRLLSLAKIYGFWKYSTDIDAKDTEAYLDLMYHTLFKPRAQKILEEHNKR